MFTMNTQDLLVIFVALTLGLYLYLKRPAGLPLPPGPKKLPLIGNLLDMPAKSQWEAYRAWAEDLESDVIHLSMAGTDIIVLDSLESAYDLLERKSAIYSSRPRTPMVRELMGWDWAVSTMPYGGYWLEHRKLMQQEFGPSYTSRYHPHMGEANQELLRRLIDSPDNFLQHVRHMAGQTIVSIVYGIDVLPSHDPYIECAEAALASVLPATVPGAFLVNNLPILKYVPEWFPGAGFRRKAKEWRKLAIAMVELPFNVAKAQIAEGVSRPSFTSSCLHAVDPNGDVSHHETVIKGTAGSLYSAGSDTTVSALSSFILAMVWYPEVQSKAQKELDTVLGEGHLPSFEDEDALPYIGAIVKEVLRWKPVTPLGIAHVLEAEDTYKGYRIPAGSICLPNIWSILHDERTYPEPSEFKPERFMKDGKLNPEVKDPSVAFGFGRRICPGRFIAQASIWITVASILSCFEISKAVDENGSIIEPTGEYKNSIVYYPLPFKCSIKPRSTNVIKLVRSTAD